MRAVLKQVSGNVWKIWGLVNARDNLIGVGTYKFIPFLDNNGSINPAVFMTSDAFKQYNPPIGKITM